MGLPLAILAYRRILARPDPLFPDAIDARRFAAHLRLLTRWFRAAPACGTTPSPTCCAAPPAPA